MPQFSISLAGACTVHALSLLYCILTLNFPLYVFQKTSGHCLCCVARHNPSEIYIYIYIFLAQSKDDDVDVNKASHFCVQ